MTAISKPRLGPGAWQCFSKHAFKSMALARKVARRMSRKDRRVAAYHCPHCKNFHVGGQH